MNLAILPPDYRCYIATFMHPIELNFVVSNDALAVCILIGWHAGVETIMQSDLNIRTNINSLANSMPEMLLKYPSWRSSVSYNDPVIYEFINKITVAGYELELADWSSHCVLLNLKIVVINAASQIGNIALMHKIKNAPERNICAYLNTYAAVEHNQLEAVLLLLSWGAGLYNTWLATVRFNRLEIMHQLPRLHHSFELSAVITHGLIRNYLDTVMYLCLNANDGVLLEACKDAIRHGHPSIVISLWNRHEDLRSNIRILVASHDLQYLLF